MFLTIVTLAMTTLLVFETSVNGQRVDRVLVSAQVLSRAHEALNGYAITHGTPGTLPCPDTDGDGIENPAAGSCASQLGLLPYKTIGLPETDDSSGAMLWYAVELNYVNNAASARNSSTASSLSVDGDPTAFVVIAPGPPLDVQERKTLVVSDFLEGINADANLASYSRSQTPVQNDQVSSQGKGLYWSLIERRVLAETRLLLNDYRTACGEYPWAAPFGGPYISTVALQAGGIPLATALPFDWGSICLAGTAPTPPGWLALNWQDQLFYSMCTTTQGNCVTISGSPDSPATGALLAPGMILAGQARPGALMQQYFEASNRTLPYTAFEFATPLNHTATYNDVTRALTP